MNNCLIRFTLGPVSSLGLSIFGECVRTFTKTYPEADYVICHNGVDDLSYISTLGIRLHKQDMSGWNETPYDPKWCAWKLYPPRLALDKHELFVDNDIVLCSRVPEIDLFFRSSVPLVSEARYRRYGKYERFVKPDVLVNGGIFGVPPHFDFCSAIHKLQGNDVERGYTGWYDEQGMVAAILATDDTIVIPRSSVLLVERDEPFVPGMNGYHFANANVSEYHKSWNAYRASLVKLL